MNATRTASKELRAVARAAKRKVTTEAELRAAILAARNAGATLEDIGTACNLSKQGVHYLLRGNAKGAS